MSESERMPGYRNRSQVPPSDSRASRIAYVLPGQVVSRWQPAPTPERPAPTISTSRCSRVIEMRSGGGEPSRGRRAPPEATAAALSQVEQRVRHMGRDAPPFWVRAGERELDGGRCDIRQGAGRGETPRL